MYALRFIPLYKWKWPATLNETCMAVQPTILDLLFYHDYFIVLIYFFDIALSKKFGCDDGVMLFQLEEDGGHVLPSLYS